MIRQSGLGLPELLLGLLLSSLLMSLFVSVFIQHKKQHHSFIARIDQDEELYLTVDMINEAVKMAGFSPCRNLQQLKAIDRRQSDKLIKPFLLEKNQFSSARMASQFISVLPVEGGVFLRTHGSLSLKKGDAIILADCYHAEVHELASLRRFHDGLQLQLKEPLFFNYPSHAFTARFLYERWMMKSVNRQPQLYYELNHHGESWSDKVSELSFNIIDKNLIQLKLQPISGKPLIWTVMMRNLS